MSQPPAISIVIPVLNEASTIRDTLASLSELRVGGVEVIVIDGGSDDETVTLAGPLCDQLAVSRRGRALQMNAGAAMARGGVLVFLHADTRLPAQAAQALEAFAASQRQWGRFDVRLSGERWVYRLIETLMNLRSRLTGIATGDQAIFVRRFLFQDLGGFREVPLMEDVELCRRLKRISRPYCIPRPVVTDSRRWETHGPWSTIVLMWRLRWRYWRGEEPSVLAQAYRSDVRQSRPDPHQKET